MSEVYWTIKDDAFNIDFTINFDFIDPAATVVFLDSLRIRIEGTDNFELGFETVFSLKLDFLQFLNKYSAHWI